MQGESGRESSGAERPAAEGGAASRARVVAGVRVPEGGSIQADAAVERRVASVLSRAREVERALVSRESIRLFFARACAREEERGRRALGVRGMHELLTSVEFCASRMIEAISGLLGLSPGLVDHASAMAPLPSATHDEVATGFWGEGGASSIP